MMLYRHRVVRFFLYTTNVPYEWYEYRRTPIFTCMPTEQTAKNRYRYIECSYSARIDDLSEHSAVFQGPGEAVEHSFPPETAHNFVDQSLAKHFASFYDFNADNRGNNACLGTR